MTLYRELENSGSAARAVFSRPGMVVLCLLALLCVLGAAQSSTPPVAIHGVVKSGSQVIPGVTITAVNQTSGAKIVTSSDVDGSFSLQLPDAGRYAISTQMAAFAQANQEVTVAAADNAQLSLQLVLLSRVTEAHAPAPNRTASAGGRGFQSLRLTQGEIGDEATTVTDTVAPAGMPVPGLSTTTATESVAVSGNSSNSIAGMSSDEFRQRMNDAREQGSGFGGFGSGVGGGPGGGGPGIFRGRGFDINRPHGMVYYTVGDSALDASPYSLTGQPTAKPAYLQNRFGISFGGPLNIPRIYKGGDKTFFFVNYNGSRGENPYDSFSTVPTALERGGNFSQSTYLARDSNGNSVSLPVQLFNPATGQFGNTLQAIGLAINPVAQGLLKYIPLPDLSGTDVQNFHFVTSAANNSDDLNLRLNRALGGTSAGPRQRGPRNNLSLGFHYHSSSANLTNPFPSVGGSTSVRSFDVPVSYVRSFGKLTNIARVDFNRSRTRTQNLYAFSQNIAGTLGITGVSQDPFDWGLPNLSFSNFGSLADTNPQLLRNQTLSFSDNLIWVHGKHSLRWGGDFRRIQLNTEASSDARGTFVFTGLNTSQTQTVNGLPQPVGGFDFADFLLGLPQQTRLETTQPGANNYHFRGNSWDLYLQDEWRRRGNLTLNLGVRYEYVSPFSELNDRIANLLLSPGVLNPSVGNPAVNLILPGPGVPGSLIHPDRNNFAPRVGIAWKPFPRTVVRAGYGINYNTGAYQTIAQQLAFQPPFAFTETNIQSAGAPLSLQNGFPPPASGQITNNYAVDPNYRLGYVQIWNFDLQQEIRPTLLLNLDYTGTKGTRLDILADPNRTAAGLLLANVQAFNWETSAGDSSANAASVRLRKRLSQGFSVGGTYTFSKALDNASVIGGGAAVVAQNAFDLAAERGLSSFDHRHKFTADYLIALPFGHDKRWLNASGPVRDMFGDWQWSGDWTIASGLPFTPRVLGDISDVNRGTNGTLRADTVPGQSLSLSHPSIAEWFNTAAFVAPPPGQYGMARRNSITGPGSVLFDTAFTKLFPLKDSRTLELRAQLNNVFNTPQYASIDTIVNSPTFGRVISIGAMRTMQLTARFRF